MNRESFILYTIHKSAWMSLSNEDAGLLIKAILNYLTGEPVSLPPVPSAYFTMIKAYLDRDAAKWAQTVEKRRQAGAKGGAASGRSRRKQTKQEQANEANASGAYHSFPDEANEANASFAQQTKQTQANEANQANPSCIDMSCFVFEEEDSGLERSSHTQKRDEGQRVCVSPAPMNAEDIEEARDAVRAERRRGDYEFSLLRQAYDEAKPEGQHSGRDEFLRLFSSPDFPGIDELLESVRQMVAADDQWRRGYVPKLENWLHERMWTLKPRKPIAGAGADPEPTAEDKAMDEKIAKMRADLKAKEAAKKKARGW